MIFVHFPRKQEFLKVVKGSAIYGFLDQTYDDYTRLHLPAPHKSSTVFTPPPTLIKDTHVLHGYTLWQVYSHHDYYDLLGDYEEYFEKCHYDAWGRLYEELGEMVSLTKRDLTAELEKKIREKALYDRYVLWQTWPATARDTGSYYSIPSGLLPDRGRLFDDVVFEPDEMYDPNPTRRQITVPRQTGRLPGNDGDYGKSFFKKLKQNRNA